MRACINNQQIRHHNKCVILELLYRQKRANKSTLARLAQISIPAVSNILQELESEKRVVNIDDKSQTRGHSSGTWGARRIRKKSYAKVFRASVRAETSRLPVCGSAARRNRRLG